MNGKVEENPKLLLEEKKQSFRKLLAKFSSANAYDSARYAQEVSQLKIEIEELEKQFRNSLPHGQMRQDDFQSDSYIKTKIEETDLINKAITALRDEASSIEREQAINELMPAFLKNRKHRKFAILLGRLFKGNHEYEKAIKNLSLFLTAKEEAEELDIDYGAVLYNRACYEILLWNKVKDDIFKENAYADLEKSIKYFDLCREQAKEDIDFESIWDDDKFKDITTAGARQESSSPQKL